MKKPVQYGGQALIEGVMMRGPKEMAMAIRLPSGEIEVTKEKLSTWPQKKLFKLPIIRGFVALIDSLIVGMKAMMFSANRAIGEEEGEELSFWETFLTVAVALVAGLVIFVGVPTLSAELLREHISGSILQNLLEGLIRLALLVAYIILISRLKDIQRVFQYHGAEHKTIFMYEGREELTVQNARKYSTLHPRCGTSFLLIVVVVSIAVFAFLGLDPLWWRIVSRVILMPLVAGIAYEILKYTGRHADSFWVRILILPGMLLQKLTTREPDDDQIEVAIAALKGVVESGQALN